MGYCPDCGCESYNGHCVNCHEETYIMYQNAQNDEPIAFSPGFQNKVSSQFHEAKEIKKKKQKRKGDTNDRV